MTNSTTATMSSPLADMIRARAGRDFRNELSEQDLAVLQMLDVAESEAVPTLLTTGAMLGLNDDGWSMDEVIDRIVEQTRPEMADSIKVIGGLDESVTDHVWGVLHYDKLAAYCLGLAIGRRLGGAR